MNELKIKGVHCQAVCALFKETILDFSTSLIRLRVDRSVTDIVRYSSLHREGEIALNSANAQHSMRARLQGTAY